MDKDKQKLLDIYKGLDDTSRRSLLDFAAFLSHQEQAPQPELAPVEPQHIEPKENESVIQAVKRLSASYPMLDKAKLLNDTSALMMAHTVQGREREEVIVELEEVFRQHYQNYLEDR
ncbi:MAG: Crp/Fnr family transcriptional regulator [Gammaproteobacteria bacterium]|nr:Crp/Fnr family transcriptional regulator [Gammaproteobacteria bacterium]